MKKILGVGSIVGLCILLRMVPHMPNVAPMTALALFSGYAVTSRWGVLIAPLANLIADLMIGFYSLPVMVAVYGSYVIVGLIGRWYGKRPFEVAVGTLMGSFFFFITTNGAVWAAGQWYAKTPSGLLASYMNGLPFFRNSLIGDIVYSGLLYVAYSLYVYRISVLSLARGEPIIKTKVFNH